MSDTHVNTPPDDDLSKRWAYIAIAVVAGAIMLVEVSVTRVLAFRLFYHYVFLVISTALLGLSAAASMVALLAGRGRSLGRGAILWASALFVLLIPLVLFGITRATPAPNVGNGKVEGATALYYLPVVYVMLTALFFAAGIIVAILFARHRKSVSTLYFSDLAGAAACAVSAVVLMKYGTPLRCFLAAGLLVAVLGLVLARRMRGRVVFALLTAALAYLFAVGPTLFDPGRNVFKKGYQGSKQHVWNHQARVDLRRDLFIIDADASTRRAPLFDGPGGSHLAPINPFYELPYDAIDRSGLAVAIIGAGGGVDIYNALRREAEHVVAIELNQSIYEWMTREKRSVYNKPGVEPIEAEGRHALRSRSDHFDLIQLSLIDTYTASAQGAYALSENFLYTVEAFDEYLERLKPGGVLYITRWLFDPPRETLRLFAIGAEVLKRRGVTSPENHMALVAEHRGRVRKQRGGFLLSRDPIDDEMRARIVAVSKKRHNQPVYLPGVAGESEFHRLLSAPDKSTFYDNYIFRVDPPTDDQPFFFQYFRLSRFGLGDSHFVRYMSQVALFLTLALAIVLGIVIVLLPSRRSVLDQSARLRGATGVYFACLGFGFMLVEIPLIQRFTLYLGHPTHALVTILSSLLVFAALGSLIAGRLPLGRKGRLIVAGVGVSTFVLGVYVVPLVCASTLGVGFAGRVGICLLLLAPLGLMLGLPLTLGVRSIADKGEAIVAWGWAANGATSVISACLAMITLIYLGYAYALFFGSLSYLVAAVMLVALRDESAADAPDDSSAHAA